MLCEGAGLFFLSQKSTTEFRPILGTHSAVILIKKTLCRGNPHLIACVYREERSIVDRANRIQGDQSERSYCLEGYKRKVSMSGWRVGFGDGEVMIRQNAIGN